MSQRQLPLTSFHTMCVCLCELVSSSYGGAGWWWHQDLIPGETGRARHSSGDWPLQHETNFGCIHCTSLRITLGSKVMEFTQNIFCQWRERQKTTVNYIPPHESLQAITKGKKKSLRVIYQTIEGKDVFLLEHIHSPKGNHIRGLVTDEHPKAFRILQMLTNIGA